MPPPLLLLLFLLLSSPPLLLGHCSAQPLQLNDDVLGLILFKSSLVDNLDQLSSWTEDADQPCSWTGVTCDSLSGRVVSVDLRARSLSGRLGRGLGRLVFLRRLLLSENQISGDVSEAAADWASLPSLRLVDLSYNLLSGGIDPAFALSPSLRLLDLSHNRLSSPIPPSFFSAAAASGSLRRLSLASNLLSGPVPDTLAQCRRLKALNISGNSLSGGLPDGIATMARVSELDLSYNALSAASLPLFPAKLVDLRLQGNRLSADIGSAALAFGYAALEHLDLSRNAIAGTIPASFASALPAIQYLDLSLNRLSGAVPAELFAIASLVTVSLQQNQLSGSLPIDLFCGSAGALESVDLSSNAIVGSIPAPTARCTTSPIGYMNLSYNRLTSASGLHPGATTVVLDLSHNQLSGEIGALDFGRAKRLAVLRLQDNNLTGAIPPSLLNCSSLIEINLSQNHLTGPIPAELGNLTDLTSLDLSYNNFSGGVPAALGWLQRLAAFNVSYNWLQGMIPEGAVLAKFDGSAYKGNSGLCGRQVGVDCSMTMPKPAVLDPNAAYGWVSATTGMSMRKLISSSAILAMAAAAAIAAGVAVVLVLNRYARRSSEAATALSATPTSERSQSFSSSSPSSSLSSGGQLVMLDNSAGTTTRISSSVANMLGKNGVLGRGTVGSVYKAVLTDGRAVAVKKSAALTRSQFTEQVNSLAKISHPNLLPLLGYYWTPQLQFLIFEFAPEGNLQNRLHQVDAVTPPLDWASRLKIALGTAHGLAHLHHACNPPIIHYSLKSNNILLDERWNPKITDHGLASKLMGKHHLASSGMLGYMAPEFASRSSNIGDKYDVYGYGVILLELVTGRRPVEYRDDDDVVILSDFVRALLEGGRAMSCVDPRMSYYPRVQVLPFIKLGLICTSQVPSNRPSMREVVQILELIQSLGGGR